ncbi:DUF2490 domain-containing protein [Carboxylicivirga taeanensis]|uniref:DUF2490 domain-containing protein n=1 Tax=Carboxylicivirga taeanensis TaxID=1416875 RepID=UPI003F6DD7A8
MMFNDKGGIILFLLILFTFSVNPVVARDDAEEVIDEYWQELYAYASFNKKLILGLLFNDLYSVQKGNYDWFIEGGIKYRVNSWLTAEALFRQEYYKQGALWTYESRPMLRFSGSKALGMWKLRNRQRFEMRFFERSPTRFRYRTDVKVLPHLRMTSWNLSPYVQEELFVSDGRISRIRSYLGVQGKRGKVEPSIYLLLQSKLNRYIAKNMLIYGMCIGIELN